jgi:hypothetical protein
MRINEILTESQLQQLEEGPMLNAFGRGVGKFAGGVAKGVGAVAGGVHGAFNALKKGYQTGKAVVGDDPDPNAGAPGYTDPVDPAARTANTTPAPAGGATAPAANAPTAPADGAPTTPASTTTPPSAAEINAQGPEGSAPAKPQTGDAGKALAKSTAVVDKQQVASQEKANQTVYAQVKANVDKLDKKGKQRILQMLQKSMSAPAPKAPAAAPGAAPAATAGAGAMGQMANQLAGEKPNTMANAPVSKTNVAKPGNPNAAPAADPAAAAPAADPAAAAPAAATKAKGGKVAGQVSQTPGAIAKRGKRQAAASAKSAGAGAFGGMANTLKQQNASKDNYGNALSEALAQRVEMHKQKMFETGLARGTLSVFRK